MYRRPWLAALTCLLLWTYALRAPAQELPTWLRVRPSYLAYQFPSEPRPLTAERRGPGYLTAAGIGIASGGAALAVVQGSKNGWCRHDERVRFALPIGLTLTGVGLVMATAGIVKLAKMKPGRVGPLHTSLMALTAAGTLLPAFLIPLYANQYTYSCL